MGNVIGSILPNAIGIAISPIPIVAVILMLFSKKAKSNSLAFFLGWVVALIAVSVIVLLLADAGKVSGGGTPSTVAYVIKLVLGLLLLFLSIKQWKKRPKKGEQPHLPKWMATIDSFSPWKALTVAFVLVAVNPKNLALALSAAVSTAQASLDSIQSVLSVTIFVIIASITVAAPVLYFILAGRSAEKILNICKNWLSANNAIVMFFLLVIFGIKLSADSLIGLI